MIALSNDGLISAVRSLVKEERRITREILDHIGEVARRRLYADLGYSSIFDWLVKDLGYSESAAYRRMQAARLLMAVPEVAAKLESGELGLTVLSKVQTLIRADEKRTGEKMSAQGKSDILAKVESCSGREAEFRLASHFPDLAMEVAKEKVRVVGDDQVSVQVTFTREQFEKLKRIQELMLHTDIEATNATLLDAAMDAFLEKKDPLKKVMRSRLTQSDTAAEVKIWADSKSAKPRRKSSGDGVDSVAGDSLRADLLRSAAPVKPSMRNLVFRRSNGQCEYRAPNGRRCESRHLLEVDHIQARALGGTNAPENLRSLCRTHNLLMAEQTFDRAKIDTYRLER